MADEIHDEVLAEIAKFNEGLKNKSKSLVDALRAKLAGANMAIKALRSEYIDHPLQELRDLKEVKDFSMLIQFSVAPKTGKRGRKPGSKNKVKAEPAKKRTISPAHRKAIIAAQKARWAKIKAKK